MNLLKVKHTKVGYLHKVILFFASIVYNFMCCAVCISCLFFLYVAKIIIIAVIKRYTILLVF